MGKPVCLLIIEDTEADFLLIADHLRQRGLDANCRRVSNRQELAAALEEAPWDVALSDFNLADLDIHDCLALIRQRRPDLPVILITGSLSEAVAVELLGGTVADFVLKRDLARLMPAIRRAVREARERLARQQAEAALRDSQAQLQAVFDHIHEGIITADLQGRLLSWNRSALAMYGYARVDECLGDVRDFAATYRFASLAGEALSFEQWPLPRVLRGEVLRELELRVARLDQDWERVFSFNGSLVRDAAGQAFMALLSMHDISERKAHEEAQRWASLVFSNIQDGVVVTDRRGAILAVNPAFTAITGYTEAEVLGGNMRRLQSGHHGAAFYQELWQAVAATGSWQGEIWDRRKNGESFLERLTISAVRDSHGEVSHYVGTFTDVTRIRHAHQMEYLAYHDPLTGLPNRLQLLSRLGHALEITRRHRSEGAVLFLDLDGFKAVNDTWGHAAGDQLLQQVAQRLLLRLRDMDTLARLGGDELVMVLEDIDGQKSAETVAGEVIQLLGRPFRLTGGEEVHIGGSIGIALFPKEGDSPDALLEQADAALYRAKAAGRNTYRINGD